MGSTQESGGPKERSRKAGGRRKPGRSARRGKRPEPDAPPLSESEQLLLGGPLRYDMGWNRHGEAFLELNFRAMITRLPILPASGLRLALPARHFSGGHELSGGQWQRLGIARAAYRRGRILIVDEPTAALDARAELEVLDRIRALADSGQTVVLITHRPASVRHADLVHVLDQGRLVESGSPDGLLAAGSLYAELYALQAEQFTGTPPSAGKVPAPKAGEPAARPAPVHAVASPPPSPLRTTTRNMSVARSMTTSAGRPSRRRACANSSAGQDPRGPPAGKRSSTVRPFTLPPPCSAVLVELNANHGANASSGDGTET
ncbi:ABC transporter domain-containing protein OS=Streptomyces griseomycini OX=66895 GN=FHS37_000211 PE=4 SV=1 [Streptomyces griseomycini]|uniref:ABC transporter domain-containing protein n=1 Tax=Streptomyces griseomycini TaxID=66895 RepID=A0A7W7PPV1_9ACTN|nr:hypothetical protein [Streptomyces griseomycini]GGR04066.1 hypothetical protein GCM10015536_06520 [Streptomyces griseomycini]